jgi:hypothetical protein
MNLGIGMSGADAIKAIRVIIPGMPAIIVSGSNHTELAKAQAALPDVTVFQKPAPILTILSKIEYLTHNTRLPNTEEIRPLWFAHLTDP